MKMTVKIIGDQLWTVKGNKYRTMSTKCRGEVAVEIIDGWKQMKPEVEGRWREREMRNCMEPKSRPAEIVNCHSGCRQTSKTDIISTYYPPLLKLSSLQPLLLLFFFHLSLHFHVIFLFARAHAWIWTTWSVSSIILLSQLHHSLHLFSIEEMSPPAEYSPLSLFDASLPLNRRSRVFGLFPLFYQFTSVILYSGTMSSHSSHRILLGSQRDSGSP